MRTTSQRFLALVLLFALCLSLFACGDNGSAETKPAESSAETLPETEAPTGIAALPDKKFDNYEFNILVTGLRNNWFNEEVTGETLNEALNTRDRTVEGQFGIKLNYIVENWKELPTKAADAAIIGSDAYDLVIGSTDGLFTSVALQNLGLDWHEIPYVDLTQPYYTANVTETYTIGPKAMLICGDLSTSAVNSCWTIAFNRRLAEQYQYPNLFDLVEAGEWTLDKIGELSRDIYEDLDEDNKRSDGDYYGFFTDSSGSADPFYFSLDMEMVLKDEENYPYIIEPTEHILNTYTDLHKLYYQNTGVYASRVYHVGVDAFLESRCVFAPVQIWDMVVGYGLRAMEDDYGILPYPKSNDGLQKEYYTGSDAGTNSQMVLAVTDDEAVLERTGIITEALNAYSKDLVTPVLLNSAVKAKGARNDEDSLRMLDLILAGRRYSFSQVSEYNCDFSPLCLIRNNINAKRDSIASFCEKKRSKCESWIEKTIAGYFGED